MAYTIASGDTLSALALKNKTTVKNLMSLNPQITDPNKIYAGQSLNITAPTPTAPMAVPNSSGTPNMQVTQGAVGAQGVVNYDPNTGKQLTAGQTVAVNPGNSTYGAVPIPASTLQPQTPTTIPSAKPTNTADVMAAGATQQSTQTTTDIAKRDALQAESDKGNSELNKLMGGLLGKGEATLNAEQTAGVPGMQQNLNDVNNQIQTKLAEFKQIQDQYAKATQVQEGKTIPMNLIIGKEAELNRSLALQKNTYASDIGLLQAQASALQGNLTLAKETADRAVDLKYEDAKTVVDIKLQQLGVIKDKLTAQEKIVAADLDRQYQAQKDQLAITVANAKDKNSTLLNLMQSYPDAKISLTDTIEQANQKITATSKIYADKIRGPVGSIDTDLSISQKNDFAEDIGALQSEPDRNSALSLLDKNKTALVLKYGQSNYDSMVKQVDKLFPVTTKTTPTTTTQQSSGGIVDQVGGFFSGVYNSLFGKK